MNFPKFYRRKRRAQAIRKMMRMAYGRSRPTIAELWKAGYPALMAKLSPNPILEELTYVQKYERDNPNVQCFVAVRSPCAPEREGAAERGKQSSSVPDGAYTNRRIWGERIAKVNKAFDLVQRRQQQVLDAGGSVEAASLRPPPEQLEQVIEALRGTEVEIDEAEHDQVYGRVNLHRGQSAKHSAWKDLYEDE